MIVFLRGHVFQIGASYVDVDVSGVGYRVAATPHLLETLTPGAEVFMHIHHHIREDAQQLFGFSSADERVWFDLLLSVSGIGPKVAMQVIGAADHGAFLRAISLEDTDYLGGLPGVGKKTAARLVVELKDKVRTTSVTTASAPIRRMPAQTTVADDVIEALVMLGYHEKQAAEVVQGIVAEQTDVSVEDALRFSLQRLERPSGPIRR